MSSTPFFNKFIGVPDCTHACAAQVGDFKTVVFRQQLLGFNAVRLPFTFSDLSLTPRNFTVACVDDTAYIKVPLVSLWRLLAALHAQ